MKGGIHIDHPNTKCIFTNQILMLLITMSTFLSFTLGIIFYQNTAENALQNKEREMMTLSSLTANKIERFLFERSADIKVLAASQIFCYGRSFDTNTAQLFTKCDSCIQNL